MAYQNIGNLRRLFSGRMLSELIDRHHDILNTIVYRSIVELCDNLIYTCDIKITLNNSFVISFYNRDRVRLAHITFHMDILNSIKGILHETPISNHIVLERRMYSASDADISSSSIDKRFNLRVGYDQDDVLIVEPGNRSGVYANLYEGYRDGNINLTEYNLLSCMIRSVIPLLNELLHYALPTQTQEFQQAHREIISVGGSQINYYKKYLKYKKKYMELKNKIN
jgi:hypothetical protein